MLSRRTEPGTGGSRLQLRFTLVTGQRARTLVLPPVALMILAGLLPLVGLLFLATTGYSLFHDDLLAGLTRRQIAMQYSYEERLARLRHEILNLTQRGKINEAELAERLDALARQQGQLESRTILVAALAKRVKALHGSADEETATAARPEVAASATPLLSGSFASEPPSATSAYIPLDSFAAPNIAANAKPGLGEAKPQPEGFELRLDDRGGHDANAKAEHAESEHAKAEATTTVRSLAGRSAVAPLSFNPNVPLSTRLAHLALRQARIDHAQLALLNDLPRPAKQISARLRTAFRVAGLTANQFRLPAHDGQADATVGGVGGPFVPLPLTSSDAAAFEHAAIAAQSAIAMAEKLHRIAAHVPLATPLSGPLEVTSSFGPRIDPFLGRPALHAGVDLRENYGAPVRATAAGTVVFANAKGGYGNMVEIDHGNGLSTRYAHLSSFAVGQGQSVKAGDIIGRIGETGRATGPHLHYETRINGEPVDPERFLKAGLLLRSAQAGPVP